MRSILLVSTILGTASLASAEPLSLHATEESASSTYVSTGASFGAADNHTGVGASVDIGRRVTQSLWLHAGGNATATVALFDGQGRFLSAHAGLEVSSCHAGDHVCVYAGADAGYANSEYRTWDLDGSGMSTTHDGAIGVMRLGLDVGSQHVRWRPGFELTLGSVEAAALTQSLVFRF